MKDAGGMRSSVPGRFAGRAANSRPSVIREMLKVAQQADVISFGGGLPAAELFPLDAIRRAQERVLLDRGASVLQYSMTEGIPELRDWVAIRLRDRHAADVSVDDVVVTTGSRQGLDLFARVLIDSGDVIAIDSPAYLGAIQAFNGYEPTYLAIESDVGGMLPDALQEALRSANVLPKLLYCVPSFANPTGATLRSERRASIRDICMRYGVRILEDDPYGELSFSERPPRPLLAIEPHGLVSYLGSASKIAAPGFRVGWVVVPDAELRSTIIAAKQGADLDTGTYAQAVFEAFASDADALETHLARVRTAYAARCDAMVDALTSSMPGHVRWNVPGGGMFLWVTVDPSIDTEVLFDVALRDRVVFVPGRSFYPEHSRSDGMRLNFSGIDEIRIHEGILRLAKVIRNFQSSQVSVSC